MWFARPAFVHLALRLTLKDERRNALCDYPSRAQGLQPPTLALAAARILSHSGVPLSWPGDRRGKPC
jgi:hypothetical protein